MNEDEIKSMAEAFSKRFKFVESSESNYREFGRFAIYDALFLNILNHPDYINKKIFIGEDILYPNGIRLTQQEVIDIVEDFISDGFIRNLEQHEHDFSFDLTSKIKNITFEYGSYTQYFNERIEERKSIKNNRTINNYGVIFTFVLALFGITYQAKEVKELEHKLQLQAVQQKQIEMSMDKILHNLPMLIDSALKAHSQAGNHYNEKFHLSASDSSSK